MPDDLNELASAFPFEEDRKEFLGMAKRFKRAGKSLPKTEQDVEISKLVEQVQWGFRTAQYPLPSREELKTMIEDSPDD